MTEEDRRPDDAADRRSKPPLFLRMADEGNIPGRPSPATLLIIVAVMLAGLVALYVAGT